MLNDKKLYVYAAVALSLKIILTEITDQGMTN